MEEVNLYNALYWDCPNCKARNFEESIPTELSPQEYEEACEVLGEIERNEFFLAPMSVICRGCSIEFKSKSPDGEGGTDTTGFDDLEDLIK